MQGTGREPEKASCVNEGEGIMLVSGLVVQVCVGVVVVVAVVEG